MESTKTYSQIYYEKNKKQVLQILWISFTIIITFTILAIILSNMVRKIFEKYNNEIDKKNL